MSKDKPRNVPASIRQRLLDLARRRREDFQLVLIQYAVERLLYRLSLSPYSDEFVLKGARLFQLWSDRPHRSTLDLDLAGFGDDSIDRLASVFKDVCDQPVEDDGLTFVSGAIRGERIREDQEYRGVRIRFGAKLGAARIPIQIDTGFGDAITPEARHVDYPTLLDLPAPRLRAYPKETFVAEKYQAVVTLGIANTRMKDFFDLWVLAEESGFDGRLLSRAIRATFQRRRTSLPEQLPTALAPGFAADRAKGLQWQAFISKPGLMREAIDLGSVISRLASFLHPPTLAVIRGEEFTARWRPGGPWV